MPSGKKKCRSGLWYKAALPPASFCYILMLFFLTVPVGSVVSAVPVILPGLPTRGKVRGANTLGNAEEDLPRDGKTA